jgi:HEAT repeat protein
MSVKNHEVRALGPQAVPAFIDVFTQSTGDDRERGCRLALCALGAFGTDEAVAFRIETTDNSKVGGWLRRKAVQSMRHTGHPDALVYLLRLSEHAHTRVRDAAVLALGDFEHLQARQALQQAAAEDADESIRKRAARLLQSPPVAQLRAAIRADGTADAII